MPDRQRWWAKAQAPRPKDGDGPDPRSTCTDSLCARGCRDTPSAADYARAAEIAVGAAARYRAQGRWREAARAERAAWQLAECGLVGPERAAAAHGGM